MFAFGNIYPSLMLGQSTDRPLLAPAWMLMKMVNHTKVQLWAVCVQFFGCGNSVLTFKL